MGLYASLNIIPTTDLPTVVNVFDAVGKIDKIG